MECAVSLDSGVAKNGTSSLQESQRWLQDRCQEIVGVSLSCGSAVVFVEWFHFEKAPTIQTRSSWRRGLPLTDPALSLRFAEMAMAAKQRIPQARFDVGRSSKQSCE